MSVDSYIISGIITVISQKARERSDVEARKLSLTMNNTFSTSNEKTKYRQVRRQNIFTEQSITEGFSPILYRRPDVVTLGNPFDTMERFHLNVPT